jgi:tRNA pseudouridine13 synthase
MLLFTYQSYLWNEGVRRYLQMLLPREHLFPMKYQAGTLLFHRDAKTEVLDALREATFPLLAPDSHFKDPLVKQAVDWVLGREKLTLQDLRIEEASRMLYFKHEERPMVVIPHKLVVGRVQNDDLNRGYLKTNIAFTLPPGAYATLVVKRLFHFEYTEDTAQQIRESWRAPVEDRDGERESADTAYAPRGPRKAPSATPPLPASKAGPRAARRSPAPEAAPIPGRRLQAREAREDREVPVPDTRPSQPSAGFLERQRQKKDVKEQAREQTRRQQAAKRPESRKKK